MKGCDFRFDGLKLMEILRDKRLMFVGDSVQRGMFESMVCLVHSSLPKVVRTSLKRIPPRKVFRVEVSRVSISTFIDICYSIRLISVGLQVEYMCDRK